MKNNWFQRYLLPGLIFQSAIIAGAYGSGQELAQFFLGHGPLGGLLGMLVTMIVFSVVLMAAYEFARRFQLFDYRSFCKKLLGPIWPLYEILFILIMILVISIIGAAAGDILRDTFALPTIVGTASVMILIALLVFFGTPAIERFLAVWSFVLYATYGCFFAWHLIQYGPDIVANLTSIDVQGNWIRSGILYSGYNMATVPVLIFCIRHQRRRREALIAGALAGPLAMLPAMLFFVTMIGQYDVLVGDGGDGALPVSILLNALSNAGFFVLLFPIVLFGTFVETGAAIIHGFNERLDRTFAEKGKAMPKLMRPVVAAVILITAVTLADVVGLTTLVAEGYGTITWGFLLVMVLPLLTYGVWQIVRSGEESDS
jgi:uncharacterized membrane protein YkvI